MFMKSFLVLLLALSVHPSNAQDDAMKMTLDGEWLFKVDSTRVGLDHQWFSDTLDRSDWQTVHVPEFWEHYPGLASYDGWGWFTRTVRIEKTDRPLSLHFAGVDDDARVWVNGIEVGSHSGYSEPLAVQLDSALRYGDNRIVVLVIDDGGGGGIYKPVTLIETKHLDDLLKSPFYGRPAIKSANWVKDAVIYEVYLRSFSREGNFTGLEKRIPDLKSLGVTVLWLMPVHPVGMKKRKGTLGSPYAVQDYYGINPEFGTMQDFKRLLNVVHKNSMKLIIDLVANHTSWDNKLITEHPDWYTKDGQGNIVSPNADWTDVADLDYSKPGLRHYMIQMMLYWVRDVGIDGYRCDVAELVPTDFWEGARAKLNRIKPVMMLSEGSIPEHHMKAFDLTYSWNIYNALDLLINKKKPATLLDALLKSESLQFPVGAMRLRFNTNHDKNAWEAPAVEKFGMEGLKLSAVLTNTIPGVPLIYTGEEVANDKKLSLFEKVDVDWSRPREVGELYQKLFALRAANKALSRGEMERVPSNYDQDVYAFFRIAGKDRVLTVLNFSSEPRLATVTIPMNQLFPGQVSTTMREIFLGDRIEVGEKSPWSLTLALEPLDYRVYVTEKN
ncbi:MAG: alpha-amlyase [Bacteroidetes bacterium]|nr:alpha-amlyase [Bacteroidota bacterium]